MQNSIFVGIGASAGGLKALEKLVKNLPKDSNNIYVIALHSDPNKKSSLVEILSRFSTLLVEKIDKNTDFLPNRVYVIPPGYNLGFKNANLILEPSLDASLPSSPSIDILFKSLSDYAKSRCVGIVLTGTGKDGSIGIENIKKNKGFTIAQNPNEAYSSGMPQNAINTGYVDRILDVKYIARYLSLPMLQNKKQLEEKTSPNILQSIKKILKEQENFNIDKYKDDTIMRRINKRILLAGSKSQEDYLEYIKNNNQEVHLLYQDILIGVTSFFRDKTSFKSLEKELTLYLKNKPKNYELRVWSIACSSGEEAYSLAILISQISKKLNKDFFVHIFATDIDDEALDIARSAFYPKSALENIDKNLLDKYFIEMHDGYKVVQSIREQIVFTHHNLLSEPPFIKQDIISCRNLLIYIKPETQQEIFTLFHYALKDHGVLFLGSSESTLLSVKYFLPLDIEHKIYKKERLENPPRLSSHYFSKHLEQSCKIKPVVADKVQIVDIEEKISKKIFDFFAPECLLIDRDYSIIYKKGKLPFLNHKDGFVTLNILDNISEELRYDLTLLISKTFDEGKTNSTKFIEFNSGKEVEFLRIIAQPFNDVSGNMLLLYFQKLNEKELEFNSENTILAKESLVIDSLVKQLQEIKKENRLLIDKINANKENMQLLNEELQSSNEELQSSNEELETSNEELQCSNEELQCSILNIKTLKKQLSLILNSTLDGLIGLDLDGRVTFVNDAATKMFGFARDELLGKVGHRFWHHTRADGTHFPIEECTQHYALKDGVSKRSEDLFWRKDGTSFEVEVSQNPIIENGLIQGSVLYFHDITERNNLKKMLQKEHQLADLFMSVEGTIVLVLDLKGDITMINKQGCKLLRVDCSSVIGKNFIDNFIPKEIHAEIKNVFNGVVNKKINAVSYYNNEIIDAKGNTHLIAWTNNFIKDIDGNITGIISSGFDITNEQKLLKKLAEEENLYRLTFEEADVGIAHASLDGKWIDTNTYLTNLLGYTKEEFKKLTIIEITHPDDIQNDKKMIQDLLSGKSSNYHIEKRYINKNGSIIWVNIAVVLLKNEFGKALYFLKIIRDITELKLLMYQLENEETKLKNIIEFIPTPVIIYDEDGQILIANKVFKESLGYIKNEITDIDFLVENIYKDEDKKAAKEFYARPFKTKKIEKCKQIFFNKSGEKRVGILNSIMLHNTYDDNKKVVVSAIVDITELQNKEEIMIAQSRQAAMGDMLAMIAHQWRQPLSVISMVSNNLHADMELGEKITVSMLHELIKTLDEQTQYLSHTIDDFREFFKPDKIKETMSSLSLFEKIVTLMKKSLENNNIILELPENKNISIETYPNQLIQVLINIISNAKDAIKQIDKKDGYIKIELEEKSDILLLSICNNGAEIDSSVKHKLGQPYVSTKSKNGTGLGVYMSNIIVTKHLGGKLYWESNRKKTCFYIELPKKY